MWQRGFAVLWRGFRPRPSPRPKVSNPIFPIHALFSYTDAMETYRITPDASVYYVTNTVVEWLPVFVSAGAFRIVTDSLAFCHAHKGMRINA